VPNRREGHPSFDFALDGSVVVGYIRSGLNSDFEPYPTLQRVTSDFQLHSYVTLVPQRSNRIYTRALDDGTVLVLWRRVPEGTGSFAQKFGSNFQPIGQPVPIHPYWRYAAATHDGRFVVGSRDSGQELRLQLYDASLAPVGEPFTPAVGAYQPPAVFAWPQPLVYDDSGAIWLVWYDNGAFSNPRVTLLRPYTPGDMNQDGVVNNFDIDPFVAALIDPALYEETYGIPAAAGAIIGDLNADGALNNFDIDPFVACLTGGECP
jgi:hypothetical protein